MGEGCDRGFSNLPDGSSKVLDRTEVSRDSAEAPLNGVPYVLCPTYVGRGFSRANHVLNLKFHQEAADHPFGWANDEELVVDRG